MAVKRRTIWMDEAEWTRLRNRATYWRLSTSRAIVKAVDGLDDQDPVVAELTPNILRAMGGSIGERPFAEFRPVPKPGKGR